MAAVVLHDEPKNRRRRLGDPCESHGIPHGRVSVSGHGGLCRDGHESMIGSGDDGRFVVESGRGCVNGCDESGADRKNENN